MSGAIVSGTGGLSTQMFSRNSENLFLVSHAQPATLSAAGLARVLPADPRREWFGPPGVRSERANP
jgi:hypothetical protein